MGINSIKEVERHTTGCVGFHTVCYSIFTNFISYHSYSCYCVYSSYSKDLSQKCEHLIPLRFLRVTTRGITKCQFLYNSIPFGARFQGQKFSMNPQIHAHKDSHQQNSENWNEFSWIFQLLKVIWQESMDFRKIPLGKSKQIFALVCKFVTLDVSLNVKWNHYGIINSKQGFALLQNTHFLIDYGEFIE